jgi:hypothetical protein
MLGLDWLIEQDVEWKFGQRTVVIQGHAFQLLNAKPTWRARRVILQEDVTLPARTQISVKVRTVYSRLEDVKRVWATVSTEVQPGIKVARAVVEDAPKGVLLPIVNLSNVDVTLAEGTEIAPLEEVDVLSDTDASNPGGHHHLEPLWTSTHDSVSTSDRLRLKVLLTKYSSVFSTGERDLGRATAVTHKIDTGASKPVRQALRRQPISLQAEIDQQLRQMEEQGIIYPSQSE